MANDRQYAPATERNRQPILEVLQKVLPDRGTVLEIASGTGEHAAFFAPQLAHLQWLPTEPQAALRDSIRGWRIAQPAANFLAPLELDVSEQPWPGEELPGEKPLAEESQASERVKSDPITAIVNINMIHISPWAMCEYLMAGAERVLPSGGVLYLYGPFRQANVETAPGNESFDRMLRDRNPAWGLRDLETVCECAIAHSLIHLQTIPMPANNLSVVFHRQ